MWRTVPSRHMVMTPPTPIQCAPAASGPRLPSRGAREYCMMACGTRTGCVVHVVRAGCVMRITGDARVVSCYLNLLGNVQCRRIISVDATKNSTHAVAESQLCNKTRINAAVDIGCVETAIFVKVIGVASSRTYKLKNSDRMGHFSQSNRIRGECLKTFNPDTVSVLGQSCLALAKSRRTRP